MKIVKKFVQPLGDNMELIKETLSKEIDSIRRYINTLEDQYVERTYELDEAYQLLEAYKLVHFDMFGEDY
jgi:flagellar capping protein FliD